MGGRWSSGEKCKIASTYLYYLRLETALIKDLERRGSVSIERGREGERERTAAAGSLRNISFRSVASELTEGTNGKPHTTRRR